MGAIFRTTIWQCLRSPKDVLPLLLVMKWWTHIWPGLLIPTPSAFCYYRCQREIHTGDICYWLVLDLKAPCASSRLERVGALILCLIQGLAPLLMAFTTVLKAHALILVLEVSPPENRKQQERQHKWTETLLPEALSKNGLSLLHPHSQLPDFSRAWPRSTCHLNFLEKETPKAITLLFLCGIACPTSEIHPPPSQLHEVHWEFSCSYRTFPPGLVGWSRNR